MSHPVTFFGDHHRFLHDLELASGHSSRSGVWSGSIGGTSVTVFGGTGMTRSRMYMLVITLGCLLALPTTAHAQSAFAGIVKDATGAVLPGVTVEASSPALIEQVRTATTDSSGNYKIDNIRPGT